MPGHTPQEGEVILEIPSDAEGLFVRRPNRFLGLVEVDGDVVEAHVHDPGRLKEILYPGNRVLLRRAGGRRKTSWDLLAGDVDGRWIFVHSGYHRQIARWYILNRKPFGEVLSLRDEVQAGRSRIDHLVTTEEGEILVEVKGCTLAEDGVALFPDAPTERGCRHLEELMGHGRGAVIFLIFRPDAVRFEPNRKTDPHFAETFQRAVESGVEVRTPVFAYDGMRLMYLRDLC